MTSTPVSLPGGSHGQRGRQPTVLGVIKGGGRGIGMGNTCKPMAVSFQCMTKSTTKKKKRVRHSWATNTHALQLMLHQHIQLFPYRSVYWVTTLFQISPGQRQPFLSPSTPGMLQGFHNQSVLKVFWSFMALDSFESMRIAMEMARLRTATSWQVILGKSQTFKSQQQNLSAHRKGYVTIGSNKNRDYDIRRFRLRHGVIHTERAGIVWTWAQIPTPLTIR